MTSDDSPLRRPLPPRVRTAGVAAITLLLGFGGGMLVGRGQAPRAVELTVPGAEEVTSVCGDTLVRAPSETLRVLATADACTVRAQLDGREVSREGLDTRWASRYLCRPQQEGLECTEH